MIIKITDADSDLGNPICLLIKKSNLYKNE